MPLVCSHLASASAFAYAVLCPAVICAASFFSAGVRYDGGSCRSAGMSWAGGAALRSAAVGSTARLATVYSWLAAKPAPEYTMRSGSTIQAPWTDTWTGG